MAKIVKIMERWRVFEAEPGVDRVRAGRALSRVVQGQQILHQQN